jgi:hypothetical protein
MMARIGRSKKLESKARTPRTGKVKEEIKGMQE